MRDLFTDFNSRQHMDSPSFELFYYNDIKLDHISSHAHPHYEFYFFVEGDVVYQINHHSYQLKHGDYLLIPPGLPHQPVFQSANRTYRRFILWISEPYFQMLCQQSADFGYAFLAVQQKEHYHFSTDYMVARQIQGKLIDFLEESRSDRIFSGSKKNLLLQMFLLYMNRITYYQLHQAAPVYENVLYLNICDYINNHLSENLSLDSLSAFFFVSKYHLSHTFKDHMGISLHQYIIKKRLQASKNGILSGIPLHQLSQQYGFSDYTSFYRAFKKEFGVSPSEYKRQHLTADDFTADH